MAENGKNFTHDANIQGISTDIVREMFKHAGINYSLTLRVPWDRIYQQAMTKASHSLFSTAMSGRASRCSSGLARLPKTKVCWSAAQANTRSWIT